MSSNMILASDYGVTVDSGDVGEAFETAARAAIAENKPLLLPAGDLTMTTQPIVEFTGTLQITSFGHTRILVESSPNGPRFQTPVAVDLTLAQDAARHSQVIVVEDATGVEVGMMLWLRSDQRPESAWGYRQFCVRLVTGLDGTNILIDQPLEWTFEVAEMLDFEARSPARLLWSNIDWRCGDQKSLIIFGLNGSRFRNVRIEGPGIKWTEAEWADSMIIDRCNDTVIEDCELSNSRYLPNITSGSRRTTVRRFKATAIRHIDANSWAEDTLIEDGLGLATDGLIQCHPSIRTTIRRVNDSVDNANLYGFDMRGLGDVVEDCQSSNIDGIVGVNTNRALMHSEYEGMALEFTRRVTRFKSRTAILGCGHHGLFVVEDCDVPAIGIIGEFNLARIEVDDKTVTSQRSNIWRFTDHIQPKPVIVVPKDDDGTFVVELAMHPAVGFYPKSHYLVDLKNDVSTAPYSETFPVRLYLDNSKTASRYPRSGKVTAHVITNGGAGELQLSYAFNPAPSSAGIQSSKETIKSTAGLTLDISDIAPHFADEIIDDGSVADDGYAYYWSFDIDVDASGEGQKVVRVWFEVEEYRTKIKA